MINKNESVEQRGKKELISVYFITSKPISLFYCNTSGNHYCNDDDLKIHTVLKLVFTTVMIEI